MVLTDDQLAANLRAEEAAAQIRRMFKIWKVVLTMLRNRGYVVSDVDMDLKYDAFRTRYAENGLNRQAIVMRHTMRNSTEQVRVYFVGGQVVKVADLKARMNADIAYVDVRRWIFVVEQEISQWVRKLVEENRRGPVRLEVFREAELVFNVTEHSDVPQHQLLTAEEKNALLAKYLIREHQLPRLLTTDPVARYYGLEEGQVVRIIRRDGGGPAGGAYATYRCVCLPLP